jgi:hypothetical protein
MILKHYDTAKPIPFRLRPVGLAPLPVGDAPQLHLFAMVFAPCHLVLAVVNFIVK